MIYNFLQMCKELTHHSTPQNDLTRVYFPRFGRGKVEDFHKEMSADSPPKELKS